MAIESVSNLFFASIDIESIGTEKKCSTRYSKNWIATESKEEKEGNLINLHDGEAGGKGERRLLREEVG